MNNCVICGNPAKKLLCGNIECKVTYTKKYNKSYYARPDVKARLAEYYCENRSYYRRKKRIWRIKNIDKVKAYELKYCKMQSEINGYLKKMSPQDVLDFLNEKWNM